MKKETLLLYAITDRAWLKSDTLAHQVEEAIKGGITILQLREKNLSPDEFRKEAIEIKKICHAHGIPLIINDNVSLAKEIDADGVHVGQSDLEAGKVREILGPDKIIGVTAKTIEQALAAEAAGADYIGSGAVFPTATKKDAKPMDKEVLKEIVRCVSIPVVAIGGIDETNASYLAGTQIAGIAVVSGIFSKKDIRLAAKNLKAIAQSIVKNESGFFGEAAPYLIR